MKILLVGANGKMGKIVQEVCNQKRIEVVLVDKVGQNVKQVFDEECEMCDVMLDFSSPDAFDKNLNFCLKHKMNMRKEAIFMDSIDNLVCFSNKAANLFCNAYKYSN